MRLPRQILQRLPGHHAVLVVAEQVLQALHRLHQPTGGVAQHRDRRLRRVPRPLGLLARLVQREVPVVPAFRVQPLLDQHGHLREVLAYGLPDHLLRLAAGRLQQGRVGDQGVEGFQQLEIPLAVEHSEQSPSRSPAAGLRPGTQPGADGPGHQGPRQLAEGGRQPLGQHLLVPVDAQLPGQPLQLLADRVGHRTVEDLAVRLEGAAHPARGDPHLVHRVVHVPPHGRVELDDGVPLGADIDEDVIAGGHRLLGRRGLLAPLLLRGRLLQRPLQLRRGRRRPHSRLLQPLLDLVQERRIDAVGQLDLDLGPLNGATVPTQALGLYGIHADLGQQPPVGVHELTHIAVGAQPDHGHQLGVPHPGTHEPRERTGQAVRQRGLDLVPHPLGDGELQMPARVRPARSAAQGDRRRGEALVRGVVVGGVQMRDTFVDDGSHAGDAGQIGQAAVVGLILPLDFALRVRHDPNLIGVTTR